MGEFLFAPFTSARRSAGVKFQFFSRVDRLAFAADKKNIEEIHIGVQAQSRPIMKYDPISR